MPKKEGTKTTKKSYDLKFSKFFNSKFLALILFIILIAASLVLIFHLTYQYRIYPGISISNISLSNLTLKEAQSKLNQNINERLMKPLNFSYKVSTNSSTIQFQITLTNLVTIDTKPLINQAFNYGHSQFYYPPIIININPQFNQAFKEQFKTFSQVINQPPINAQLKVEGSQINVSPSQLGFELDEDSLKNILISYINTGTLTNNNLPIKSVSPNLSYQTALEIKNRLDQIKLSPLTLKFRDLKFTLDLDTILSLIDLSNSKPTLATADILNQKYSLASIKVGSQEFTDTTIVFDSQKLNNYFKSLSAQIDQPVQEPLFNIDKSSPDKLKVLQFSPPQEGRKLNITESSQRLNEALLNPNQSTIELPVQITQPKNQLVNDLGIKELIGRGISNFAGSINNRIFNIELAASHLNGVLVSPGETFSFVNTVGDISSQSGYKQAYVIKSGRTVLDDGGGVCQVSTTLFRTVLNSGLPVISRTAHAYRVGYYEQGFPPGLDATIFQPSVDFQFKNDTPAHILIQTYTVGTILYIDFYGTSDNRTVKITKPIITDQTPPPPDLRQDDPTIPKGTIKQVDFPAWGANVIFSRTVKRGEETLINETFRSNYRPWQAVFLVGTG